MGTIFASLYAKIFMKLDTDEPKKGNKKDTPISTSIPLAITYNLFLPNISKIIRNILLGKKSKRASYRFQTQQKSQGTHRQQKQNSIENIQKRFENREMYLVFWK